MIDTTTKPVPDSSYEVARRNLEDLDKFGNQTSGTFQNRAGKDITPVPVVNDRLVDLTSSLENLEMQYEASIQNTGWFVVGEFSAGFTYTARNQVGRDADGEFWSYNGPFTDGSFVVSAGTVPSEPNYTNRGDAALRTDLAPVPSIKQLRPIAGVVQTAEAYVEDTGFGGDQFIFYPDMPESEHNGGTVIAEAARLAWNGTQADIATILNYVGSGNGCYVRQGVIDVTLGMFGAIGDGLTDDTVAITAAHVATSASGAPCIVDNYRTFIYNGSGLKGGSFNFIAKGVAGRVGSGQGNQANIKVTSNSYFFDDNVITPTVVFKNIGFNGGKGVFRSTFKSPVVALTTPEISGCYINGFTECAVQHNSVNWPFWLLENNFVDGDTYLGRMGFALAGLGDNTVIRKNSFGSVQVAIKIGSNGITGSNVYIDNNDILNGDISHAAASPCVGIWLVSNVLNTNAGGGTIIRDNKFGNERYTPTTDFRILIAAESVDGNTGEIYPSYSNREGSHYGAIVKSNNINGFGTVETPNNALVTSVITQVQVSVSENIFSTTKPKHIVEFQSPELSPRLSSVKDNLYVNIQGASSGNVSNRPESVFNTQQSMSLSSMETDSLSPPYSILTRLESRFGTGGSTASITLDGSGGNDAVQFSYGATGGGVLQDSISRSFIKGERFFLEFDVKGTSPSVRLTVAIGGVAMLRDVIIPTSVFVRACLCVNITQTVTGSVQISTSADSGSGTMVISRPILYKSPSPAQVEIMPSVNQLVMENAGATELSANVTINANPSAIESHTVILPDLPIKSVREFYTRSNIASLTVSGVRNIAPVSISAGESLKYIRISGIWIKI